MSMCGRQGLSLAYGMTVLLGLSSLPACSAIADHERTGGNSDEGYFEIERRNVVVGAELDIRILDWEYLLANDATQVKNATVEPAERATVLNDSGDEVTLRGDSAGRALLTFTGRTDDEWQEDGFELDVVEPEVFAMSACWGYYVRGERGLVSYQFNPGVTYENGEPAYGVGFYPVRVTPETSLTVGANERSVEDFAVDVSEAAPDVIELDSTLSNDSSHTELHVVDRSLVTLTPSFRYTSWRANSTTTLEVELRATVDAEERPVCSELELSLTSRTPKSCLPVDPSTDKTALTVKLKATEATIQSRNAGECVIEVALSGVAGSVGVTAAANVSAPPESGGGGGGDLDWD